MADLVERWFGQLTDKATIRRGLFYSVPDLIAPIEEFLDAHNDDPKPFVWTAVRSGPANRWKQDRCGVDDSEQILRFASSLLG